ncbi:hypothetical protein pb186bvf_013098 [Paramecium bursaria]
MQRNQLKQFQKSLMSTFIQSISITIYSSILSNNNLLFQRKHTQILIIILIILILRINNKDNNLFVLKWVNYKNSFNLEFNLQKQEQINPYKYIFIIRLY